MLPENIKRNHEFISCFPFSKKRLPNTSNYFKCKNCDIIISWHDKENSCLIIENYNKITDKYEKYYPVYHLDSCEEHIIRNIIE